MLPSIIMYGASWCVPCKAAKRKLTDAGKTFVYVDVDKKSYPEWVTNLPAYEINGKPSTLTEVLKS